jgi:hypothetical protein
VSSTAVAFSEGFEEAARDEADRLKIEVERLRAEAARHLEVADELSARSLELELRAREIDEMLGVAPQLSLQVASHALGGEQLRLKAVEILAERRGPAFPIHYKDWYELVLDAGYRVHGRDPLATFLAQVTRSPVIASSSPNRGVYILDLDRATERAASRLRAAELALVRAQAAVNSASAGGPRVASESADLDQLRAKLALARKEHRAAQREAAEVARAQTVVSRVRRHGESAVA